MKLKWLQIENEKWKWKKILENSRETRISLVSAMGAPSQQRFFWEEKWTELRILPNKGNNNYWLIHFERLFTSQTMQWILRSDGEHSVALASDFLKISNRHPWLVLWLIFKHLESKERRLNLNCPCSGTVLSVNSSLEMIWFEFSFENHWFLWFSYRSTRDICRIIGTIFVPL